MTAFAVSFWASRLYALETRSQKPASFRGGYLDWEKETGLAQHPFRFKCTQKSLELDLGISTGSEVAKTNMVAEKSTVSFIMVAVKGKATRWMC